MTRSSAEVEAEVEAQRGRLDRTVEALKDKMTPSEIFDETAQALGGAGQQLLNRFVATARRNPMPVAVMGVGLAWMLASSGSASAPRPRSYGYGGYGDDSDSQGLKDRISDVAGRAGDRVQDVKSKVGQAAQSASERAHDMLSTAKDKLSDVSDQAREGVHSASESLKAKSRAMGNTASETRRWVSQRASEVVDSEPLLLAGLGLAVGFAIGSALPSTDIEDQALGRTRDQLLEKGKELARETLEQAGEVAQKAYGAAKDELKPDDAQPRETV